MLKFQITKYFKILILVEFSIFVLNLIIYSPRMSLFQPLKKIIYLTNESSIGTWISSFLALSLSLIFLANGREFIGNNKKYSILFTVSASIFLFMSLDDTAQIHENVSLFISQFTHTGDTLSFMDYFPSYLWQIIILPIYGILFLIITYLSFMFLKINHKGYYLPLIGLSLLVGAVFIDFIEGYNVYGISYLKRMYPVNFLYIQNYLMILEEFFEMLGLTFILIGFAKPLQKLKYKIEIS